MHFEREMYFLQVPVPSSPARRRRTSGWHGSRSAGILWSGSLLMIFSAGLVRPVSLLSGYRRAQHGGPGAIRTGNRRVPWQVAPRFL